MLLSQLIQMDADRSSIRDRSIFSFEHTPSESDGCKDGFRMAESVAVPVFLQAAAAAPNLRCIDVVTMDLKLLERVAERLDRAPPTRPLHHGTQIPEDEQKAEALLRQCDLCVVPSVLLMDKKKTMSDW